MYSRTALWTLIAVSSLVAPAPIVRAAFQANTEFQVNTYTTGLQYAGAVAADGMGNFVVVWESRYQDGSEFGIFGQRYDSAGLPLGGEFQVNTYTTGFQRYPAVAADGTGEFMVVWNSTGQDGSDVGVFGQRYDSAGLPVGGEFQVNSYTTGAQSVGSVASDGAGSFVVVWDSAGQDGSGYGVFGQRYDTAGLPLGGEFQVNTYTTGNQFANTAAVAGDAAGNFVVVWTSDGEDGSDLGIFGQRYDSAGLPVGGEFQVNSYTTGFQSVGSVASNGAGSFVVVWDSAGQDGSGEGVFGQRYDSGGLPLGAEFQVNTYTTGSQATGLGGVAVDGAGNFVVAWADLGIFGQRYDSAGVPLGGQFQVNTNTTDDPFLPVVASDGAGDFFIVWTSRGDGSGKGVFGQRNKPDRVIQGKTLRIRNPSGTEADRSVMILGREPRTGIGMTIDGDPAVSGATLRVVANGTMSSDQTYVLDASGWRRLGTIGFTYSGPTGGDADPVRQVILTRLPSGTAKLKAVIRGDIGTQSLDVVPPNAGVDGGVILQLGTNGGRYCVGFGGAAGGTATRDTAQEWKVVKATAQPGCPSP